MDITKLSSQDLVDYNNKRELKMQGMVNLENSINEMMPDAISILDEICRLMEYEIEDQGLMRCH